MPRAGVGFFAPEDKVPNTAVRGEGRLRRHNGRFLPDLSKLPVWQAGIAVSVKQGPNRVTGALNTSQTGIDAALPSAGEGGTLPDAAAPSQGCPRLNRRKQAPPRAQPDRSPPR